MPMRPVTVRMDAAGFSRWVMINAYTESFGVGLGVSFSDGATATADVQHTFDDVQLETLCNMSRSGVDLTINKVAHGLKVDDWVELNGTEWDGDYAVSAIVDDDHFQVVVTNAGSTTFIGARVKTARVFDHDTLVGLSADADGNYQFPPTACRLNIAAYTDGTVDLMIVSGGK